MQEGSMNLVPFNYQGQTVRVITDEKGEPWWVAKDVCEVLGYARPRDAVSLHCKGAAKYRILTNGGTQEVTFIPEADLYRLIMRSKLPSAEAFSDWVVEEVLPQIRKTGQYTMTSQLKLPGTYIEALEALVEAEKVKEAQKALLFEQAPKVEEYENFMGLKGAMPMADAGLC